MLYQLARKISSTMFAIQYSFIRTLMQKSYCVVFVRQRCSLSFEYQTAVQVNQTSTGCTNDSSHNEYLYSCPRQILLVCTEKLHHIVHDNQVLPVALGICSPSTLVGQMVEQKVVSLNLMVNTHNCHTLLCRCLATPIFKAIQMLKLGSISQPFSSKTPVG